MYRDYRTFFDRKEAGISLGKALEKKYKNKNALVLGIPRGGVEIAYQIAKIINGEMSLIVSKKLPFPGQKELAFGAISEDGSVFLTSLAKSLDEATIKKICDEQLNEIDRRIKAYRKDSPLPSLKGRIVILADDGIATGSTIIPAAKFCKNHNVSALVIAAPVSGKNISSELIDLADDIIISEQPDDFYAVGQVYQDFHGLQDEEVMSFINKFNEDRML